MIVGGICPGDVNFERFEASAPYTQDEITWCVSHAKPLPRWMNLLYIFDIPTIIIGAVIVVNVVVLTYLLHGFEERPFDLIICIILAISTITQFPTLFRADRYMNKFLFTMMLILGLWLSTIFGAYVIVFMSQDLYATQIATIQDIANAKYQLAGNPIVIDHYKVKTMVGSY